MEPDVAYARSRGLSVAYAVIGRGALDLVVVPGFVSHIEGAFSQPAIAHAMRRLAAFARVITFDKPGTGLSDPVEGVPTLEERMEDLTAVLDAADAERVALFGVSEGAPMSALFAATHPERTDRLVMYGSYARGLAAEHYPWAPDRQQVEMGIDVIEAEWGRGALLELYAPSVANDSDFRRWWTRYQRLAASPAMAKAVARLAAEIDITDVLGAISVPTLVLHRKDDLMWPVEGARFVASRIADARLVEVDGIDHFPFVGNTATLLDEVESFLTGGDPTPPPDRQLVTVLFTDIVASTERATDLGDRRWRALLEAHDDLVRDRIERFRGRELKTTGDGFLVTFDGPARAVECARSITASVRALGIEVRAGVHTGECEVRENDVSGVAVHIAARISALAGPGEVLVSSTVRDLVAGSGLEFEARGTRALKGVPGEWSVLAAIDRG